MSKVLENMGYQELLEAGRKLESQLSDAESQLTSAESKVAQLQFQLDQMNRLLYGSKRERFIKDVDEGFSGFRDAATRSKISCNLIGKSPAIPY